MALGASVLLGALAFAAHAPAWAQDSTHYFGVLNQRSISLTAQFWNPILDYVSRQSGVSLQLKMGKTAPDTTAMTVRGEFSFVYTNHLFTPERDRLGYRVIARPNSPGIRSLIVVSDDSPYQSLADLAGRTMVFPSREAFLGYSVPSEALRQAKVEVNPVFAGNQEGAMAQLQVKSAEAAAVNSQVLEDYSRRENFRYRVLWRSDSYLDLPIMANPAVDKAKAEAVRRAFVGMASDPAGQKVLKEATALLKLSVPIEFVASDDSEYENYRQFHRRALARTAER